MTDKHTPGPWEADQLGDGYLIGARCLNGSAIAEVCTAADARLIAAAPELLAALRMYEKYRNKSRGAWSDVDAVVRAAIALAVQS